MNGAKASESGSSVYSAERETVLEFVEAASNYRHCCFSAPGLFNSVRAVVGVVFLP